MISMVMVRAEEVQDRLDRLGFPRFNIKFNITSLKSRTTGISYFEKNIVEISKHYLREHQEFILNVTVPHEICHLYVFKYFPDAKQCHGPQFRKMMSLLGLEGNTKHSLPILKKGPTKNVRTKIRYVYVTESGKEKMLTQHEHKKAILGNFYCKHDGESYCKCGGEMMRFSKRKVKFK